MTEYSYTVIIEREESGGYHAFCPALRGYHSQGDSYEETVQNITEAIQYYPLPLLRQRGFYFETGSNQVVQPRSVLEAFR